MNVLEEIGFHVQPIRKKFKPFQKWRGTSLIDYEVELQIITVNDQIRISHTLSQEPVLSLQYTMKIELLACALKLINGRPIISDEEFSDYKAGNKVADDFSCHDYIVLKLKQFPEQVINALYFTYEELQNAYVKKLCGDDLPADLKLNTSEKTPPKTIIPDVGPPNDTITHPEGD